MTWGPAQVIRSERPITVLTFGDRRGDAAAALTFPLKLRLLAQSAAGQTHCTGTCRDFFFFLFLFMQSRVIVRFERSKQLVGSGLNYATGVFRGHQRRGSARPNGRQGRDKDNGRVEPAADMSSGNLFARSDMGYYLLAFAFG